MKIAIDISKMHEYSKTRGIGFYVKYLIDSLNRYTNLELEIIEKEKKAYPTVDLIHFPFFDLFRPTLPLIKKRPTVVTIHDVTPLVFPQHYPPGLKGSLVLRRQKFALRDVKAVITDSLASKKDIKKYLKYPSDKIFPIYLAQGDQFKIIKNKKRLFGLQVKYKLPKVFVLYTGNVNWNKNLINLVEACMRCDIDLVLSGSSFEVKNNLDHPELKEYAKFLKLYSANPKIHILGFVPGEDLVGILNLANVFLFPSYYEGFGLPILEAQACGIPVIAGDTSSMIEILGESGVLVNPYKVEEITEALKMLLKDKKKRELFRARGFKNIKRFSWQKAAIDTLSVYKNVLNNQ